MDLSEWSTPNLATKTELIPYVSIHEPKNPQSTRQNLM